MAIRFSKKPNDMNDEKFVILQRCSSHIEDKQKNTPHMNQTFFAKKEKQLRRLETEKRAYLSAARSHEYTAKLFPKKSREREQLLEASQDALAWAAELQIQIDEVRNILQAAKIAQN